MPAASPSLPPQAESHGKQGAVPGVQAAPEPAEAAGGSGDRHDGAPAAAGHSPSPKAAAGNDANVDAAHSLKKRTGFVEKLLKMGTIQRNAYLDLIDPPKKTPESLPSKVRNPSLVDGGLLFPREQHPAAFFLAVIAVQTMGERICAQEAMTADLVGEIQKEGLGWYKHCTAGVDGSVSIPYEEVFQNMEGFNPISLKPGQPPEITKGLIQPLAKSLREAAKERSCLGAIVFEGDITQNPRVYGVVAENSKKAGATHFHVLNPYDENGTVVYRRFNTLAEFTAFFIRSQYSMMALEPKSKEGAASAAGE